MEELSGPEERAALLAAFEADLPRLLPEVRIVDRGLNLSRGPVRGTTVRRADFVAIDGSGRPLIVLLVDGRGDDTVLAAVNALAFARQSADALARPRREEPVELLGARVALIAEAYSARTLEGLALLPDAELLLFEARRVESVSGSQLRVARLSPFPARREEESATRESFLARVVPGRRATARLLLERLARIDAAIASTFEDGAASFRCDGRELCAIEVDDGTIHGSIPALKRRLPIHGPDDADAFLDEVLREHILLLGEGWGTPAPAAREETSRGKRSEEPLLTREEIEAFRE